MRRGEIWVASFRPWRGREVGKSRPCVILQADWLTEMNSGTILALPMTAQLRPGSEPLRIPIAPRGRLKKTSHVMVDKLRALDRGHFGESPIANLDPEELTAVERSLKAVLGLL